MCVGGVRGFSKTSRTDAFGGSIKYSLECLLFTSGCILARYGDGRQWLSPPDTQPHSENVAVRIAEIYKSIQGEGVLTGTTSGFVRVTGCNLRCWFCDTPYTSWDPQGENLEV